jgi:hypothetical protein
MQVPQAVRGREQMGPTVTGGAAMQAPAAQQRAPGGRVLVRRSMSSSCRMPHPCIG